MRWRVVSQAGSKLFLPPLLHECQALVFKSVLCGSGPNQQQEPKQQQREAQQIASTDKAGQTKWGLLKWQAYNKGWEVRSADQYADASLALALVLPASSLLVCIKLAAGVLQGCFPSQVLAGTCCALICQVAPTSACAMQVPWGRKELAIGMISWGLSFVAVGLLVVPLTAAATGVRVSRHAWAPRLAHRLLCRRCLTAHHFAAGLVNPQSHSEMCSCPVQPGKNTPHQRCHLSSHQRPLKALVL